jgi:hypothetical protein
MSGMNVRKTNRINSKAAPHGRFYCDKCDRGVNELSGKHRKCGECGHIHRENLTKTRPIEAVDLDFELV